MLFEKYITLGTEIMHIFINTYYQKYYVKFINSPNLKTTKMRGTDILFDKEHFKCIFVKLSFSVT